MSLTALLFTFFSSPLYQPTGAGGERISSKRNRKQPVSECGTGRKWKSERHNVWRGGRQADTSLSHRVEINHSVTQEAARQVVMTHRAVVRKSVKHGASQSLQPNLTLAAIKQNFFYKPLWSPANVSL